MKSNIIEMLAMVYSEEELSDMIDREDFNLEEKNMACDAMILQMDIRDGVYNIKV